ncbi:unnamed protein product, partial [Caenorhabditis auriculariae]
ILNVKSNDVIQKCLVEGSLSEWFIAPLGAEFERRLDIQNLTRLYDSYWRIILSPMAEVSVSGGGRRSDRSSRFGRQDGFTIADETSRELPGARKQLSNEKTRGHDIYNLDAEFGLWRGRRRHLEQQQRDDDASRNDTTTSSSSTTSPAAAASEKSTASPPFLKLTASRGRRPSARTPRRNSAPLMDVKVPVVPELQQVPQIECLPNGEIVNIPGSMLTDQFGLAALVSRLRHFPLSNNPLLSFATDTDYGDMSKTTPGAFLEMGDSLSLMVNGIEMSSKYPEMEPDFRAPVWKTFAGPFRANPLSAIEITAEEFPPEYYLSPIIEPKVSDNMIQKIGSQELLYMFYNMPRELWQEKAARELYCRNWRYNVREKFWLRRHHSDRKVGGGRLYDMYGGAIGQKHTSLLSMLHQVTDTFEFGIYDVFDSVKFKIMTREMKVIYEELEQMDLTNQQPSSLAAALSSHSQLLGGAPKDPGVIGSRGKLSLPSRSFFLENGLASPTVQAPPMVFPSLQAVQQQQASLRRL